MLQNCYNDLGKYGNETPGWVGEIKNGKSWKNPNLARDAPPRAGEKKRGRKSPLFIFIFICY
ncbi:MAG: hypothetical protein SOW31_00070 [Treponema sp.]|nr:hypothetical protein [Treponema sp.]